MSTFNTKKIFSDVIYSMAGVFFLNATLQFFLYPALNNQLGSFEYGKILFYISLMTIFSNSFGVATDNVRLIMRNKAKFNHGDYNFTLCVFIVLTLLGLLPFVFRSFSIIQLLLFAILAAVTLLRYYATVVYRLEINYKQYFFFFIWLSAGYAAGTGLLYFSNNWIAAFLLGELAAITFAICRGNLFPRPFFKCNNFKVFFKNSSILALSELLYNLMLNFDRLLLIFLIGPLANTLFYISSLISKTPILIIQPINNIILSYLTSKKQKADLKFFLIFSGVITFFTFLLFVFCRIVSPWFIKIFYPNEFNAVKDILTLVCLGQAVMLPGNILLVLLLTFCDLKTQFYIQAIYCIVFVSTALLLTDMYGLVGFVWSCLIANTVRYIIAMGTGIYLSAISPRGNHD